MEAEARKDGDCAGAMKGSPGSYPAMQSSMSAASATVRAIGPWVMRPPRGLAVGAFEIRPREALMPTTPQQLEGMRIDPPPSEPSAIGREACRDGRGRATARAARRLRQVPGVARGLEQAERGRGAIAELGRVRLAQEDASGLAQAARHGRVVLRHVALAQPRAVGGAQARRVGEILEGIGNAGEREVLPRLDPPLGDVGGRERSALRRRSR